MGSCISQENISDQNHLIVDVQEIIASSTWDEFVTVSPLRCRWFRRPKRSKYVVEVPMNYYLFQEDKPDFELLKRRPSLKSNDAQSTSAATSNKSTPDKLGIKTVFRNDTDQDQLYSFRFEKTRTATVEVTYQKGFSIGGSASFTLGLPQVLPGGELSAELTSNYEVTSSKGQKFEESVTTEATSEIKVSKMSNCTAKILMEERRLLARFTLRVTMSMPEGQAVVFIRDKKGNTVYTKFIENLSQLFGDSYHIKDDKGYAREDAVRFVVHGVVDGMQLANHNIHLKGRQIPAAKSVKSGAQKMTDVSDVEFSDF